MGLKLFVLYVCAYTCACLASEEPQSDLELGVLVPETRDLGYYDNIVSATIDLLPQVAEVFEQEANNPIKNEPLNSERMGRFITGLMPITRNLLKVQAEQEGREVDRERLLAVNAAEAVLPSVWTFMERLRNMKLFDRLIRNSYSDPRP